MIQDYVWKEAIKNAMERQEEGYYVLPEDIEKVLRRPISVSIEVKDKPDTERLIEGGQE